MAKITDKDTEKKTGAKAPAAKKSAAPASKAKAPAKKPAATEKTPAKKTEPAQTQAKAPSAKSEKPKKAPKLFPAKKLPGLLKKAYRADKIEKILYKKIYISSDKELVKSFFVDNPEKPGTVRIPLDKMIAKPDFTRLKAIAKDIKKNKGSFKLVPFVAVAAFIALVVFAFITFKNPIAKKGMIIGMQKVFGARTDIARVNVELLKATITVNGLQQANANEPMKNLFQIDKTEIKFNLTEALRGKFDAQNIEVTGLQIGTDRSYSGELPEAEKASNPYVEKFTAAATQKKEAAISAAKDSIEAAFAEYNPENMIKNVQDNLKSPALAKEVQAKVEASVEKWKNKPAEVEAQVKDFSDSVNTLVNKDWSNVNDPIAIKNAITDITNALQKSKSVTNSVKGIANDIKADGNAVRQISSQVQEAIKADTELVNKQLKKITSFNMDTGTQILSNAFNSALYAICGDYYPYVSKAIDAAMKAKQSASSDPKETQKKAAETQKRHERLPGIDVWYKNDNVPRFLIEKISFSGLGVSAQGFEISNDMDKRGSPATLTGSYQEGDRRTHKAKLVVDARSKTNNPLVGAEYTGNNYPFGFESPYLNLASNTTLTATGTMDLTGAVSIGAKFNMKAMQLTADEFEPAIAYRFYSSALSAINNLTLGAQIGIDAQRNLSLKIDSDLDKQFNTILRNVVNKELGALMNEAKKQITEKLGEQTGGVTDKISQFINLENGINAQSLNMDALNKELNAKKAELQKQLQDQAAGAIGGAAGNAAGEAIGGALKKLF
ncbi:MAG: TIGR03545 family protein [Treponema sp.]|nr:TIGR03545 family protein [Treponema sp.]